MDAQVEGAVGDTDRLSRRSFSRQAALAAGASAAALAGVRPVRAQDGTPAAATPEAGGLAMDAVRTSLPHLFDYEDFQFQFLIALGQVYERAADVGELFATAALIRDYDYDAWFDAFYALAERINDEAEASDDAGQIESARDAFLRASTYYSQAAFFADGTKDPSRLIPTWEQHRVAWEAFAERIDPPAEAVTIPYEGTTLPGYAFTVDNSGEARPWLIMNNGSDGTTTDMWAQGAAEAQRRGYNVLIFDGPGQGAVLYRQNLPFRYDWEKVITPVVDWLLARSDVDAERIAILGISQGGYWVPRAVAFEHRIAAAIADPGVMDVGTIYKGFVPPEVVQMLATAEGEELKQLEAEIQQGVDAEAAKSPQMRFMMTYRLRPYGTTSFPEVLKLVLDYNLTDVVGQIQCPMLIADPEGEQFWPGQSQQLYDALTSPKTLVKFTAAEGADLHCEPKALGLRAQRFFDWLDATLGGG
jgi:alpha-beta hydrolase superfamily lysophospholipase